MLSGTVDVTVALVDNSEFINRRALPGRVFSSAQLAELSYKLHKVLSVRVS